jgi:hypothetical protein
VIEDLKKILDGQHILIISPKYFGYQEIIVEKLKSYGTSVVWVDGRPDNSFVTKAVMRYFPFLYKNKIADYYNDSIKISFDQILIINPEYLSANIIFALRKNTGASRLILYMWDSFLNKKNVIPVISCFDKVLTFDIVDAKRLNLFFRPLFFSPVIHEQKKCGDDIDISFIGTGHSDRAKIVEDIRKQCIESELRYFFYLYLQNKFVYYFHKITNKHFRRIKKSYFNFRPIDYDEYMMILRKSTAIIDIEHPRQRGLTMRTFEVLGNEKKLITTNENIKDYDFYNASNILVIDRSHPVIDKEFFNKDYQALSMDIYYKYSIDGWLEDIFNPVSCNFEA